jgi:hypothetical protein
VPKLSGAQHLFGAVRATDDKTTQVIDVYRSGFITAVASLAPTPWKSTSAAADPATSNNTSPPRSPTNTPPGDPANALQWMQRGRTSRHSRGGRRLFVEGRVDVAQFEYNARWVHARRYLRDAFTFADALGYQLGKVTPRGIEFYEAWHPERLLRDFEHAIAAE